MANDIILIADKRGNPIGGVQANKAAMRANAQSILRERLAYGLQGTQFGGTRDYYEILGYVREPDYDDYQARFDRDPIAGTIVEFPCSETWRDTPTIKDGKDKEAVENTAFCNAWSDFAETMNVYSYCQAVDTLAGIGEFALLHIGVSGHGGLNSEVRQVNNISDIIYFQPYSQDAVEVYEWQTNPLNPRYGLPHIYKVTVSHMDGAPQNTFGKKELLIHWSRCIHVAEGLLKNRVFGRPRLQRVINLLDDIMKVVGGSAEATWLLIRKGFVLDIAPDATIDNEALSDLEEQFDEYNHGIRRFLKTRGMKVQDLGSEVVDPSGLFDVIITLISVATRIPKRILLGSERGELASSQDASNWAGFIAARQLNYAEPMILRPLIDRVVKWGAIPKPSAGRYTCVWDALFELNDTEKANNMLTTAKAIQAMAAALGYCPVIAEEWRGEYTPWADTLPDELKAKRDAALDPVMPEEGDDVLKQVSDLPAVKAMVAQHGYSGQQAQTLVTGILKLMAQVRKTV